MTGPQSLKDYYQSVFESDVSDAYDHAPGKGVIVDALKLFGSHIAADACICDIGCGTGTLLERIRTTHLPRASFVGIDFAPAAITRARQLHPGMVFLNEDGAATSLPPASIDVVISYGSYEHFANPDKGLGELSRILKPGGLFFTLIPALEAYWEGGRQETGWYADKTGQMQWNYPRATWAGWFGDCNLNLWPEEAAVRCGARHPGVFFFGSKR